MSDVVVWIVYALLATVRLTIGLAATPLFSAFRIPMLARLVLVIALGGLAAQASPHLVNNAQRVLQLQFLLPAVAHEMVFGLLLALGVHVAFACLSVAGRLMDTQVGFNMGAVLDPVSKGHAAVMSSGLDMLAVLLFFVSDAHHIVLSGYFRTFEVLPIGGEVAIEHWMSLALASSVMFSMGFVVAAPVVVALLLADVVVAVVSRNLPQMNVLILSIPLKILLGISILSVGVRLLGPVLHQVLLMPVTLLDKAL